MLQKFKVTSVLLLLATGLVFQIGCENESSNDNAKNSVVLLSLLPQYGVTGYWRTSNASCGSYCDGFEVNASTGMYYQYDNEKTSVSYAGTIVDFDREISSATDGGYITIKITDGGTWGKTVGKYYVVHLKSYTGNAVANTIKESSAYKSGAAIESGMDTQVLADTEFTVANGYFGFYGDYVKQ